MIKVLVQTDESGEIRRIELHSHADYDQYGRDIVCAGVSACFQGALYAFDEEDKCEYSLEPGNSYIQVKEEISQFNKDVLKVLVKQLELIARDYPKNVKVTHTFRKEKWKCKLS